MSTARRAGLWLMAAFYVFAGVMHFVRPEFYLPMMPTWLPAHRELILLSGAAEILLGLLLLPEATRRLAAWGVVLLLIAVFPA
ncbi:MAG: DoxX family protein, partial [Alphaproteobacteria bacterium]